MVLRNENKCSFQSYFCTSGMSLPLPCERGFYCPSGSANPHPCPAGTYGNKSGLVEEWQCSLCDPGLYCKGTGTMHLYSFYPISHLSCVCDSCSLNLILNSRNIWSESTALMHKLYISKGGTFPSGPCAAGFVCVRGASEPSPSDSRTGFPCPPGFFCTTGTSVPKPCPKGTFRYSA